MPGCRPRHVLYRLRQHTHPPLRAVRTSAPHPECALLPPSLSYPPRPLPPTPPHHPHPQAVNFTKIPVEHQLLAVNCATLLDAMFLSWARAQDDWVGTARAALEEMQRPKQQQAQPGATVAVAAATATVVVVSAAGGAGAVAQQQQRRH